jgi:hypothetical protein
MMGAMRSKAPSMISITSSGSIPRATADDPFTSENRIVTTRRSPDILSDDFSF